MHLDFFTERIFNFVYIAMLVTRVPVTIIKII